MSKKNTKKPLFAKPKTNTPIHFYPPICTSLERATLPLFFYFFIFALRKKIISQKPQRKFFFSQNLTLFLEAIFRKSGCHNSKSHANFLDIFIKFQKNQTPRL